MGACSTQKIPQKVIDFCINSLVCMPTPKSQQPFVGILKLLELFEILLGYRVVATGSPGMASPDPFRPEPHALERPPFLDGFNHILRTRRRMPTMRTEQGGKSNLVNTDG